MLTKLKEKIKPLEKDIILVIAIMLVALTSFGLGRLSKIRENKPPITVENLSASVGKVEPWGIGAEGGKEKGSTLDNGMLVASKGGKKYHYPWCPGARRIKDSNKIWFSTKKEAASAGYTPAKNCKGLK